MLVELIGPAGAGKSALVRALTRRDSRIMSLPPIAATTHVRDALSLLPRFVRFHSPFEALFRKEMKRVLYLTTLERVLNETRETTPPVLVMDEGAAYMLARMLYFGGPILENEAFREWWHSAVARWARALRILVWLDADTGILAHRIRARGGRPPICDLGDAALVPFLERYRACYRMVVRQLTATEGPVVTAIDTGSCGLDAVAARALAAIHRAIP